VAPRPEEVWGSAVSVQAFLIAALDMEVAGQFLTSAALPPPHPHEEPPVRLHEACRGLGEMGVSRMESQPTSQYSCFME
jgi:hypothetical protein